jgi:hypothetical protein
MSKPAKVYRGSNVVESFLSCLLEEEKEISDILDQIVPMKLTKFEEKQFQLKFSREKEIYFSILFGMQVSFRYLNFPKVDIKRCRSYPFRL